MEKETHKGRCRCGAVAFEVTGPPKWTANCHCADCRKSTGAAFASFAGYEWKNVAFAKPADTYPSSPGVKRHFCAKCGSPIAYEGERWPGEIHFFVGAFDEPDLFPPEKDGNLDEKLAWVHVNTKSR